MDSEYCGSPNVMVSVDRNWAVKERFRHFAPTASSSPSTPPANATSSDSPFRCDEPLWPEVQRYREQA